MSDNKELFEDNNEPVGTVISEEEAMKICNFKELSEEELVNVAGGDSDRGQFILTGHVGQYDAVIGEYYYVACDRDNSWEFEYGKLVDSYEDPFVFGTTVRRHRIHVLLRYRFHEYEEVDYYKIREGKNYSLYTRAIRKKY